MDYFAPIHSGWYVSIVIRWCDYLPWHQGIDIPDIEIVVQWRTMCDLSTLWQRFGRAAREPGREALAVLFVEAKYFDEERAEVERRTVRRREMAEQRVKAREQGKRPRNAEGGAVPDGESRAAKRARMGDSHQDWTVHEVEVEGRDDGDGVEQIGMAVQVSTRGRLRLSRNGNHLTYRSCRYLIVAQG